MNLNHLFCRVTLLCGLRVAEESVNEYSSQPSREPNMYETDGRHDGNTSFCLCCRPSSSPTWLTYSKRNELKPTFLSFSLGKPTLMSAKAFSAALSEPHDLLLLTIIRLCFTSEPEAANRKCRGASDENLLLGSSAPVPVWVRACSHSVSSRSS